MRKVSLLVPAALTVLVALSGCGERTQVALKDGMKPVAAPYGREEHPSATDLTRVPTIAVPERNVELRTRSEDREDDAFDLPPPESSSSK